MPLVANTGLPSFQRLQGEGSLVIPHDMALSQHVRELHIGLLNMMPDKALEATERQFFRLIGSSNRIARFYVHPFTLDALARDEAGRAHVDRYYQRFSQIQSTGLDALIITGANLVSPELDKQEFWEPLIEVLDWASDNVTSVLCSCLATHAVLQFRYRQKRRALPEKRWGIFPHHVCDRSHPLVTGVNTRFDVPHSRFNEVGPEQFAEAGLKALVEGEAGEVHLAVSEDGFRLVFFQGHPEYDANSLLKEYKREVDRYASGETDLYPPFPRHYFSLQSKAMLNEYRERVAAARTSGGQPPDFPEALLTPTLQNTWHDSAAAVMNNWMGIIQRGAEGS